MDFQSVSISCDTFEAITQSLKSLASFNKLIDERHQAGYKLHMRLNEWIVLGRFMLDTCGNFMKIKGNGTSEIVPAEKYPDFPAVMLQKDLWPYIESHKDGPDEYTSICSTPSWRPSATQICPVCNKGWDVSSCHDVVDTHQSKLVDLSPYIGKDIAYFKTNWNQSPKITWAVKSERSLRNKKYIDHTIIDSENGRLYQWQVNERGWVEAEDNHIIEPGDRLIVNIWTLRHEKCFRQRQAKLIQAYFHRIFVSAGYENIQQIQIPNQYHGVGCKACAPWFDVVADDIHFIIGWRKRVIEIETTDPRINLTRLFPQEDVTKDKNFIHAWGRKKCVEYLSKIRLSLF